MSALNPSKPPVWQLIAAFAAVYVIWGSTYLGIRFAVETIPPFLMAGMRFLISGLILYAWTSARGAPAPTRANWRATAIIGALLLLGGNGGVTWAEQRIPSGLAALLVALVPLWMVLLNWLRPGGVRPGLTVTVGVLVGLAGIALLVAPGETAASAPVDMLGVLAVMLASFSWANGSIYSQRAPLPASPLRTTAMEMLAGGTLLLLVGTLTGEWARLDLSAISGRSLLAMVYLIFFGGIIAYSSFVWLLTVTTPARAATYAYVNPVVAVFLGWALAGEALTVQMLVATAVIVAAVVVITSYRDKKPAAQPLETAAPVHEKA